MRILTIVWEEIPCHGWQNAARSLIVEVLEIVSLCLMKTRLDFVFTFKGPLE
jgi:hypothetical protein